MGGRRLLLIAPEFGVDPRGGYKPGGMAQFSRATSRALASATMFDELSLWGLLDDTRDLKRVFLPYIDEARRPGLRVRVRGFSGSRLRMAAAFARRNHAYDQAMFMHVGVGRLANLRVRPYSFWLVGIEVRRLLRWEEARAVSRARPLLSISTYSARQMLAHNPGLPMARTVHLGLEPDGAWASGPEDEVEYRAAARAPAVLIVGRLSSAERYKGHDQLIEGWPAVLERAPNAELWIAGDGDDRARLEEKARSTSDRIRFFGRVSHDELVRLYKEARVFSMPSTGEGFGLVFLEAMARGLPCVCSHDSAAEIVLDGETGLVVDQVPAAIADACVRLLVDDELADRASAAGRRRLREHFTFEAFRQRMLDAIGGQR